MHTSLHLERPSSSPYGRVGGRRQPCIFCLASCTSGWMQLATHREDLVRSMMKQIEEASRRPRGLIPRFGSPSGCIAGKQDLRRGKREREKERRFDVRNLGSYRLAGTVAVRECCASQATAPSTPTRHHSGIMHKTSSFCRAVSLSFQPVGNHCKRPHGGELA